MLNDYIARAVLALVGLAVLALLVLIWRAWTLKVRPWIDTRLTATQREIIERLARDAYAWVEKNWPGIGREKFEKACEWLAAKLGRIGINIPPEEIEAAVQRAWEEFNAQKPTTAPVITVNVTGTARSADIDEIVKKIEVGMQESFRNAAHSVVDPKS